MQEEVPKAVCRTCSREVVAANLLIHEARCRYTPPAPTTEAEEGPSARGIAVEKSAPAGISNAQPRSTDETREIPAPAQPQSPVEETLSMSNAAAAVGDETGVPPVRDGKEGEGATKEYRADTTTSTQPASPTVVALEKTIVEPLSVDAFERLRALKQMRLEAAAARKAEAERVAMIERLQRRRDEEAAKEKEKERAQLATAAAEEERLRRLQQAANAQKEEEEEEATRQKQQRTAAIPCPSTVAALADVSVPLAPSTTSVTVAAASEPSQSTCGAAFIAPPVPTPPSSGGGFFAVPQSASSRFPTGNSAINHRGNCNGSSDAIADESNADVTSSNSQARAETYQGVPVRMLDDDDWGGGHAQYRSQNQHNNNYNYWQNLQHRQTSAAEAAEAKSIAEALRLSRLEADEQQRLDRALALSLGGGTSAAATAPRPPPLLPSAAAAAHPASANGRLGAAAALTTRKAMANNEEEEGAESDEALARRLQEEEYEYVDPSRFSFSAAAATSTTATSRPTAAAESPASLAREALRGRYSSHRTQQQQGLQFSSSSVASSSHFEDTSDAIVKLRELKKRNSAALAAQQQQQQDAIALEESREERRALQEAAAAEARSAVRDRHHTALEQRYGSGSVSAARLTATMVPAGSVMDAPQRLRDLKKANSIEFARQQMASRQSEESSKWGGGGGGVGSGANNNANNNRSGGRRGLNFPSATAASGVGRGSGVLPHRQTSDDEPLQIQQPYGTRQESSSAASSSATYTDRRQPLRVATNSFATAIAGRAQHISSGNSAATTASHPHSSQQQQRTAVNASLEEEDAALARRLRAEEEAALMEQDRSFALALRSQDETQYGSRSARNDASAAASQRTVAHRYGVGGRGGGGGGMRPSYDDEDAQYANDLEEAIRLSNAEAEAERERRARAPTVAVVEDSSTRGAHSTASRNWRQQTNGSANPRSSRGGVGGRGRGDSNAPRGEPVPLPSVGPFGAYANVNNTNNSPPANNNGRNRRNNGSTNAARRGRSKGGDSLERQFEAATNEYWK